MKRTNRWATYASILLIGLMVFVVAPVRAQEQGEEQTDTGVARISLIRGDVFMTRGDSGDQVAAKVNMPLVRGDKLFTGEKSQTEIQLDHANVIRLAPSSEIRIADLTRSVIQIQVAQGLVNYTVLKTNEAQIELDTPNMAVRPVKEGSYRIQVTTPTETQLIVRKGDADVTTPEGTTGVDEGRIITVRGSDNPEYQLAKAPGKDDWDKWNKDRDDAIKNAKSYKYANNYYTGAQDLDRNGRWVYMPDYGDYAWTPYVSAGWAPYSSGYWGWQPYWGWTWISYEPWGWAPYHYGRWSYYGSSWYWYPGHHYYGYRPLWGPAWVSFIGFGYGGYNWGFGFGYGYSSIGWCPLGRYDSYSPWWGRHNSYNAVNITNITNITNVTNINRGGRGHDQFGRGGSQSNLQAALTNSNVRGGITRVSTDDFMRGNFSRAQRGVDANTLRGGQLVQGRIPVAPTRETLRPVERNTRTSLGSGTDRFFSRREPPAVNRSFNEQAASVQNMMRTTNPGGATGAGREASAGAAGNGFTRSGASAGASATTGAGNRGTGNASVAGTGFGRGREATASRTATSPGSAGASGASQPGWSKFGQTGAAGGQVNGQAGTAIAQRNAQGTRSSGQAARGQAAPAQGQSWRRFGTGQPRVDPGRPTTTGSQPGTQTAPSRSGQAGFGNTNRATQGGRSGEAPAPRIEGGNTLPQSSGGSAAPSGGWRRFGSRSDSSGAERPALGIRKSITTERSAPRTFERGQTGGSGQTGQGSAPASTPRGFEGGGRAAPRSFERGTSGSSNSQGTAPSSAPRNFQGSGRTAPSSSPRSFEGGGGGRVSGSSGGGYTAPRSFERSAPNSGGGGRTYSAPSGGYGGGGGSRGWSGPSGGGAVRSAPSGGGNRSYSAPSGGYGGGGGRGASAPSGGGGGGRSAPSSSRGGGNSGRR